MLSPVQDGILIPLDSAEHRLLQAPTTVLQNPPHLGRVVGHPELFLDDLDHPPPGPDFPGEPEGRRPSGQQLREPFPLLLVQLG